MIRPPTGFGSVIWLLLRGDLPSPGQAALLEAALVAGVDHGPARAFGRDRPDGGHLRARALADLTPDRQHYDLRLQAYRLRPADLQPNTDW
jgi:hypothetical protein